MSSFDRPRTSDTTALTSDPRAAAVRALGSRLVVRFGLEYDLEETPDRTVLLLRGDQARGTADIRLFAEPVADGGMWFFHESAEGPKPIAEVGSPDVVALVMRARQTQR